MNLPITIQNFKLLLFETNIVRLLVKQNHLHEDIDRFYWKLIHLPRVSLPTQLKNHMQYLVFIEFSEKYSFGHSATLYLISFNGKKIVLCVIHTLVRGLWELG